MWKKFNKNLPLLLGMLFFLALVSCIEEPTIPPVERAFSVIRIGNFTTNVDEIDVRITEDIHDVDINIDRVTNISNITNGTFTEYFDLYAGKREVLVLNSLNGDTLLDKTLEATAYNYLSWYFSGYFHPSIDTSTFAFFSQFDGLTYLDQATSVGADSFSMVFLHLSGPTDIDSTKNVKIFTEFLAKDSSVTDTSTLSDEIAFGEIGNSVLRQGDYTLHFISTLDESDTLITFQDQFNERLKYFIYLTGEPKNPVIVKESKQYLIARPK